MLTGWKGAKAIVPPPTRVSGWVVSVTGAKGAKLVMAPPIRVKGTVVMVQGGPDAAGTRLTGDCGRKTGAGRKMDGRGAVCWAASGMGVRTANTMTAAEILMA
jgi:hypothetical protein